MKLSKIFCCYYGNIGTHKMLWFRIFGIGLCAKNYAPFSIRLTSEHLKLIKLCGINIKQVKYIKLFGFYITYLSK
jgi:hypothetical protein